MKPKLTISFGALSGSISDQVKNQGYSISKKDSEFFEDMAKQIVRMSIFGLLIGKAIHNARQNLVNLIFANCKKELKE